MIRFSMNLDCFIICLLQLMESTQVCRMLRALEPAGAALRQSYRL